MPSRTYRPVVGRSRQPRMFIRVDLPEPDGPMIATNSPASIVELNAVERPDLHFAQRVDLGDVLDRDHQCRPRLPMPGKPAELSDFAVAIPIAILSPSSRSPPRIAVNRPSLIPVLTATAFKEPSASRT